MVLLLTTNQCGHSANLYCFPPIFKKKAVPKRNEDDKTPAPPLLQENVFIEVSRPKYLEDLHTEALEGLKMMQQEERIIGTEYQDNESTISTVSTRAEVDGGGFTTDSTIPDSSSMVSMQSSVSSRSSRSGLTRQGSTFRPLNSGKRSEKGRIRRRHRKTIGAIPQHVQREFGFDRAGWSVGSQLEEEQFLNGEVDESPSTDVPLLAVHSPQEVNSTEVVQPLGSVQEEQLSGSRAGHVDDMVLLQRLGPAQSAGDRPWSLAVPGMTTSGSHQLGPPSPVMSMSPQAAYLSKIIPNAVLPPSIEVVEINRGGSRNSVRTVSKSSLLLSSPTSSRASSRASSARTTSSRSSTITSASRHNHFHLSDSSCWSNSDSDTLVSDSSTISSSSTPRQSEAQDNDVSKKHVNASKSSFNGKNIGKGDESKKDGHFGRSLSVMKPKRAPPPPSRSYSLHKPKFSRRSRDFTEVKFTTGQTMEEKVKKIIDSPGYNADTSSLDESNGSVTLSPLKSQPNPDTTKSKIIVSKEVLNEKKEVLQPNNHKVISPSSGYSSQDATSPNCSSPKHKKGILSKLHKLFPGPVTSAVTQTEKNSSASVCTGNEKSSVKALRELFTIPPHPKVHAPPPPPPEVWSHSPRSIELLLGPPAPGTTYVIVKKNPKDKRPHRHSPPPSTEEERKQRNHNVTAETKKVQESQEGSLNVENRTNVCERLNQPNVDVKENGKVRVSEILNSMLVKVGERDTQRLPGITEEHKTRTQTTTNTPSISLVHISQNPPRTPTKQTTEATSIISAHHITSPESHWPPPPPPVSMGSPDETDFPPPPPLPDADILPVKVPPSASDVESGSSVSLQSITNQPLNIPPPPSYTAPPPPVKTFAEKVKVFSLQPKDVSTTPPKVFASPKISKPPAKAPPPKEIILTSTTEVIAVASKVVLPPQPQKDAPEPPNKVSTILLPPEAPPPPPPPPQERSVDILPPKVIHTPPIEEVAALPEKEITITITEPLPTESQIEILPPPDIIPPSPQKEVPELSVTAVPLVVATPVLVPSAPPPPQDSIPPPKEVSPPMVEVYPAATEVTQSIQVTEVTTTIVSPPISEDSKDLSLLPPPSEIPIPTPEQLSPPAQKEVLTPQKEVSPSIEISPPPPVEVAPSHPEVSEPKQSQKEVLPPQKEASPPKDISLPSPVEVAPSHPEVSEPKELPKEVLPSLKEVSPSSEISLTQPEEASLTPKDTPLPDIIVVDIAVPKEIASRSAVEETPAVVAIEVSPRLLLEEISKADVETMSNMSVEEAPKLQEDAPQPSEEKMVPPKDGIVTPANDSSLQDETKLSHEDIVDETNTSLPSLKSTLTPPQSVPPPPPIKNPPPSDIPQDVPSQPEVSSPVESTPTTAQNTETILVLPSEEVSKQEPALDNGVKQSQEPPLAEVKQEGVPQTANPALSNGQASIDSTEISKTENEPKSEDAVKTQEATNQVQTSSATAEAPLKPIRKSLIISSPLSPPATTSLLKPQSPNSIVTTPTNKSPPVLTPSMNLQEAIRLRTAARSHNGPSPRLSIPSPTSYDLKSPTSMASFIFSKSNKKVVTETKSEVKTVKNTSEEHAVKKEFKVPPPVAKKPKPKSKEIETGDMELTAGQDTKLESIKDTKKPNGTAGTVGH